MKPLVAAAVVPVSITAAAAAAAALEGFAGMQW
jgi:hypothetical protein